MRGRGFLTLATPILRDETGCLCVMDSYPLRDVPRERPVGRRAKPTGLRRPVPKLPGCLAAVRDRAAPHRIFTLLVDVTTHRTDADAVRHSGWPRGDGTGSPSAEFSRSILKSCPYQPDRPPAYLRSYQGAPGVHPIPHG